jgi:uncharacterized protein
MNGPFIIDAHAHIGLPGSFFSPESTPAHLLKSMDQNLVRFAIVASDQVTLREGVRAGISGLRRIHEESQGSLWYLGVFDPRSPRECRHTLSEAAAWPGFAGLKLHPPFHGVGADDPAYEPAWAFAADRDLPILGHSWSISDHNPRQSLALPERFEVFVRRFPKVRLVLAHAGGRGSGRREAIRMANEYPNVFLDFAGDIFCYRLVEELVDSVPPEKVLYGSDFPWVDPAAQLSRVLLADIDNDVKRKILIDNAVAAYPALNGLNYTPP